MVILTFKIIIILLIVLAAFLGGLLPARLTASRANQRRLTLGNAMSGGIFLGSGLLHMLPESQEHFEGFATEYPYALLLCGVGFLLVLMIEQVMMGGQHLEDMDISMEQQRQVYPYLLVLILSIHSIIAGAALGFETEFLASIILFIAIISHKGFAAFALGMSLTEAKIPLPRQTSIIGFFSVMTPLGIVFGTGLSNLLEHGILNTFEGVFGALAAGTFLYVATQEIMHEVFHSKEDAWLKLFFMGLGFALMALLAIWA